jgi:hypothetical protein
MKINVHWHDLTRHLQESMAPVVMIKRLNQSTWLVPVSPLIVPDGSAIEWSRTSTGELVRVPIFAYQTQDRALACIFGTGVELALRAAADLMRQHQAAPKSVQLQIGHEVQDLGAKFRCMLGLAFEL